MQNWINRVALTALVLAAPTTALAYDEVMSGDLSNNLVAPTPLTLNLGTTTLLGTVSSVAPADTRDLITFTIPAGRQLTELRLISYTDLAGFGETGFHGINSGSAGVPDPWTTSSPFLGGNHLVSALVGQNLLPALADPALNAVGAGFSVPLGPGTYTYVVQQISGTVRYNLQFFVSGPAPVPASQPWAPILLAGLLAAAGIFFVRKRALCRS